MAYIWRGFLDEFCNAFYIKETKGKIVYYTMYSLKINMFFPSAYGAKFFA